MSSSIVPASQAPRDEVAAYLVGQGYAPEIVAWKYFDSEFNQGRERGWVWLKDGRIQGFIGLLPFHIARGSGSNAQRLPARWLCGWSVADFESHRGAGVRLFKRALEEGTHMVLGGNDNSLSLMERMASRTKHDADLEFRIFLRAGALLDRLAHRLPAASIISRSPLKNVPLPRKQAGSAKTNISLAIEPGVSRSIAPLLEMSAGEDWAAVYDHKYLDWFLGRCPILSSWTIAATVPVASTSQTVDFATAGAVMWHPKSSALTWRAALWLSNAPGDLARQGAEAVLDAAIKHALAHGGAELSILTSPEAAAQCELLRSRGFAPAPIRRPLFLFDGPRPEVQLEGLGGLNFLAADLAYRF